MSTNLYDLLIIIRPDDDQKIKNVSLYLNIKVEETSENSQLINLEKSIMFTKSFTLQDDQNDW